MAKTKLPPGHQYKAFKGQAYPNQVQYQYLMRCIGCSRYIYNALLHLMEYRYHWQQGDQAALAKLKVRPDLQGLYGLVQLKEYKDEYAKESYNTGPNKAFLSYLVSCLKSHEDKPWLHEAPRDALTYAVDGLVAAFTAFYELVKQKKHIGPDGLIGFPNYKSRHGKLSFRMPAKETRLYQSSGETKLHKLKLPQCKVLTEEFGDLRIKGLRKLQGRYLSVAIRLTKAGDWMVSVLTDIKKQVRPLGFGSVGIDLSAQRQEVGYCYDGYNHFKLSQLEPLPPAILPLEARIKHLQQSLARKTKGSYRWKDLKIRIAKANRRLKALYEGYYHRMTNWLVSRYDSMIIEDLDAKGMLQKVHSGLAKLIQDSRFRMFRDLLLYKLLETESGLLGIADRYYPSSQLCSHCGIKPKAKMPLHVREWTCEACGTVHHRDFNAASNLYALHDQLALIEPGKREMWLLPYSI